MVRYLVDAQLPPGLCLRLIEHGREAFHVIDKLSPDASDLAVASEADRLGAILISKDEDFCQFSQRGILASPLLWIRIGNTTNAHLWNVLQPLLPEIERSFAAGEKIVELR